jgi:leucyl/phenylalanyl-tRNA--protein transferase
MNPRGAQKKIIEPDFLLMAYSNGYFPMADGASGEIEWYSPDPRAIIDLDAFNVARSLRLTLRKHPFEILLNRDFEGVMRQCAMREETWISEEIIQSYAVLHRVKYAHSVECWKDNDLVGGLYGVALGGAFFGESMFSRKRDASKVALVHLVQRLKERGFTLLDTQFITPHLLTFGAVEIPREEYLKRLNVAIQKKCRFE